MEKDVVALNVEQLEAVNGGSVLYYLPKPGDTLDSIAKSHNVTVDQLKRWNNITEPYHMDYTKPLRILY